MELKYLTDEKELSWNEFAEARKKELAETKILWADLEYGTGKFIIRKLEQVEEDYVDAKMKMVIDKKSQNPEMNGGTLAEYNMAVCQKGIVSGPKGFQPKNITHIRMLPAGVRNQIADSIIHFSRLNEETRLKFRTDRVQGEDNPDTE